jgi:hypothetical protein
MSRKDDTMVAISNRYGGNTMNDFHPCLRVSSFRLNF